MKKANNLTFDEILNGENEEQAEQITIKDETKRNFIIVFDSVYKNTNLTADELALIIKLLSLAPTFKPTKIKMMSLLHISERQLLKATKGLQEKGYLSIKKYGLKSEWKITQEPIKKLDNFNKETLLNALLNFDISLKDLKQLHKLKYIDDKLFIETAEQYTKEIQRIIKTKWINNED